MKIDKYIGLSGYTSRRKAFDLIENKQVTVNGRIATFSTKVNEGDDVRVNGQIIRAADFKPVYIVYHKPKGIICTSEKIEGNIIDAVAHPQQIYPVGRLDKDSEGLILLTNVGSLNDRITHPKYAHEKEYVVTLNLPVRSQFLKEISQGVDLHDVRTRPCVATREPGTKRIFRIVLKQGLNRQIRRMCNAYDYQVLRLQRVRIMHIHLGKLKAGEWRDLTEEEVNLLYEQVNEERSDAAG